MSVIPVCKRCQDMRVVGSRAGGIPCPDCGPLAKHGDETLGRFSDRYSYDVWFWKRKDEIEAPAEVQALLDMSSEELALCRSWPALFPEISKNRARKWIEGRRYDPATDPEVIAELERRRTA